MIGAASADRKVVLRLENTVVVTEKGMENSTDFTPMELADMEKLVLEKGALPARGEQHGEHGIGAADQSKW